MKYEVQDDVPIPDFGMGRGRPKAYPWPEVSVGQCVLIETTEINAVRCGLSYWKKKNPDQKWVTQTVSCGLRAWRTA